MIIYSSEAFPILNQPLNKQLHNINYGLMFINKLHYLTIYFHAIHYSVIISMVDLDV